MISLGDVNMYSDIVNTFLHSIQALRFYVNSVEEKIGYYEESKNSENVLAQILHSVMEAKKRGIDFNKIDYSISSDVESEIPEEILEFLQKTIIKLSENIKEKDIDGIKEYEYIGMPKELKEAYRKVEIEEKQAEILYSGSLMLLVTYFENLVSGVFKKDFIKHPQRVALDEKSVSYKVLSEFGNVIDVKNFLIDQEVTNKMYGSFSEWKYFFNKQMKLELESWDKKSNVIMEIIARRNLFVHNNGIINNIYINLVKDCDKSKIGEVIEINREYIDQAIDIIEYAGISLIVEVWLKEYSTVTEETDNILDLIFDEYLNHNRWEMAIYFYEICLKSKNMKKAQELICKINRWQCYKWMGKYEEIREEVERVDLSAHKPMYTLGILALEEKYVDFFKAFDEQNDIGEAELNEWPLFKELRESEEFKVRYSQVEEEQNIDTNEVTN